MLDYSKIRERKLREAEALGAVDIRNVRPSTRDFAYFVATDRKDVTIIPELFRRDPAGAAIASEIDLGVLAHEAEQTGALALAVATDADVYGGTLEDLRTVSHSADVPVLQVDFIVRDNQLFRARLHGADSAVLNAAILEAREIATLLDVARHMRMECVVEARDEEGIDRAIEAGARIVAIDGSATASRADLHALIARVPGAPILIVRGGAATTEEIEALRGKADAVMIGAPFLTAPDPIEFLSVLIES